MQNVFRTNTIDTYDVTHDFRGTNIGPTVQDGGVIVQRGFGYEYNRPAWYSRPEQDHRVQVAFDAIHGEYCVAVGTKHITMPTNPSVYVNGPFTESFHSGITQEYYGVSFPDTIADPSILSIPGPGYLIKVNMPAIGDIWMCLQSYNPANPATPAWTQTTWMAKIVNFDGVSLGFPASYAIDGDWGTILEIRSYCDSITSFVMPSFPDNKALSVLVYSGSDTLTSDVTISGPTGPGQYVQFVCPAKTTEHSWPLYILRNRSKYPDVRESFRYITNPGNGYIFQSNNTAKKRRIHIDKNVMMDGFAFDCVGIDLSLSAGNNSAIMNCVFTGVDIAVRIHGEKQLHVDPNGIQHYILQNLFLDCRRSIFYDIENTMGSVSGSVHTAPNYVAAIGYNTFDGGDTQIEVQRLAALTPMIMLFENVFTNARLSALKTTSFESVIKSFGNISSDDSLQQVIGLRDIHSKKMSTCELPLNGYRPSLQSWFELEMIATMVPNGLFMSSDITGTRLFGFAQSVTSYNNLSTLARKAIDFHWQETSNTVTFRQAAGISTFDASESNKVAYRGCTNSAKGCFNPVLDMSTDKIYQSVGYNTSPLEGVQHTGWSPSSGSYIGCMKARLSPNGVLVMVGGDMTEQVAVGDAIELITMTYPSATQVAYVSYVIAPGAYLVRGIDGGLINTADTEGSWEYVVHSISRAFNNLQSAIDSWFVSAPDLVTIGKTVVINCMDDVSYVTSLSSDGVRTISSIDQSSAEKNIVIPAGWVMSEDNRLVVVASNSKGTATHPGSHGGDASKGFQIGSDGSSACVTVNSDFATVKGLRLVGSEIKDPAISYIGIAINPLVSKVILDSNMIVSCQKGILQ